MDRPDRFGPPQVLVQRYAGQRLHGPAAGIYLTRGDLMATARGRRGMPATTFPMAVGNNRLLCPPGRARR